MRTTRTLTAALILTAALAGCSDSSTDPKPTPTPAPSLSASASPTLSADEQKAACVEAIVDQATKDAGQLQSEPRPAACVGLDDTTYLEAYYDALKKVNEKGRAALSGGSTGG